MSLLDDIVAQSQLRLAERRKQIPLAEIKKRLADASPVIPFAEALSSERCVIAEYKRKSPSKGTMNEANLANAIRLYGECPYIKAISVLTDEDYFDGKLEYLQQIKSATGKPVLRKDFIIDEYQVYETRAAGADAILLMTQLFVGKKQQLGELFKTATSIGLGVLFEVGVDAADADTLVALLPQGAQVVGINARMIKSSKIALRARLSKLISPFTRKDYTTDRSRHKNLRKKLGDDIIAVAESGIHTVQHLKDAFNWQYQAALIGTAFVSGPRPIEEVINEFADAFDQ